MITRGISAVLAAVVIASCSPAPATDPAPGAGGQESDAPYPDSER